MDSMFKVLGDKNRLRIINLLRKEELCVCEIEVILEISQSNVSRHLGKLKNEGMITFEKKAQWIHYRIDPQFIEENKLLYRFISEKMDQSNKFVADIARLAKYKGNGVGCEDLNEMSKIVFS